MAQDDVFAIQVEGAAPEVHRGWTLDQVIEAVQKVDVKIAASLRMSEQRIAAIQKEVVGDPDLAVEYYMLKHAQSQAEELLNCDLAPLSSDAQLKRIDQYHRYSEVGSAILYRDVQFRGGSKFFTLTWPNFKWWPYKFNDTASSAKVFGGHILFQHTWYRGRRLYLVGVPSAEFPNFNDLDFNDIASSIMSLP